MIQLIKSYSIIILFIICNTVIGQTTTSFDDMNFEDDSVTTAYKPAGKNYVFLRSKRGTGGLIKTSRADSVITLPITEIVLVFSETNADAIAEREQANQERWENLLKTYPQYFQFSTTYKDLCQCKINGDSASFKKAQGFYVYFAGAEPKVAEKKAEEVKVAVKETKAEEKTKGNKKEKIKDEPKKEEPKKELSKNTTKEKEDDTPLPEGKEETVTITEADLAKDSPKKKAGYSKPKKAKDTKVCRPACYENGDEDLNNFFKENITLTKKQRRHSKQLVSTLKLQLHFDGSIKKAMVTGTNDVLNQQVLGAIKLMNLWNPAVKGGVTIKSEVKITLKYDKETKGMKSFEVVATPRLPVKCKCASDLEIFGQAD